MNRIRPLCALGLGGLLFCSAGPIRAAPPADVESPPDDNRAGTAAEPEDSGLLFLVEPVGGGMFLFESGDVSSGAWGVNLTLGWRVSSSFHVGLRQSLNFGLIDTCVYDGEYGLGTGEMCPPRYQPAGSYLLALLGTRLLLGFDLGDYVAVRPSLGIGMYGTSVTPGFTWIPFPGAGLDVDIAVYRGETLAVRLGAGLVVQPALKQGVFLLPQGGVGLEF